jgi:hypothetical protein
MNDQKPDSEDQTNSGSTASEKHPNHSDDKEKEGCEFC